MLASRKHILAAVVVASGMAWIGHSVAVPAADQPAPGKPGIRDAAKDRAKHAPITAFRDRMLETFHGATSDLFTEIPGFGMERMTPLYKYVPFEIPDLSTNEVEVEKEIVASEQLKQAFAKSLDLFRDPTKAMPRRKDMNPFAQPKGEFSGSFGNVVMPGLQLRLLDLVGLMDDAPRVFSGGKAFEVQRMTFVEAKAVKGKTPDLTVRPTRPAVKKNDKGEPIGKLDTRPLDLFEIAGVAELRQGKDLFVRHKDRSIRMLGALRATEVCLECHTDNKKGDLLGALSYTFVDTAMRRVELPIPAPAPAVKQ
jgi:hypothetical protein